MQKNTTAREGRSEQQHQTHTETQKHQAGTTGAQPTRPILNEEGAKGTGSASKLLRESKKKEKGEQKSQNKNTDQQ